MPERRARRNSPLRKADSKTTPLSPKSSRSASAIVARREFQHCVRLTKRICRVAGDPNLIRDARRRLSRRRILMAIRRHDSAVLFDWLAEAASFRGIANSVAYGYIQEHGSARWRDLDARLARRPSCPKLASYWQFEECGYRKAAHSCTEPSHLGRCPLPKHHLRNGGLNQTAYSLFLFIRDIADGDLVGWLDRQLAMADRFLSNDRSARLRAAVLQPFTQICGISNKVASMALSPLLLAGDRRRPLWIEAGTALIAVDTLVHNFLYRTGIISRLGTPHPYGVHCYSAGGCAEILDRLARGIDARRFNPAFPAIFPRFVQHAIWHFCAEEGLDECNGHQIDDRARCDRQQCPAFHICDRNPLKPGKEPQL